MADVFLSYIALFFGLVASALSDAKPRQISAHQDRFSHRLPCRKHGLSSAVFDKWKTNYGGLDVTDACKLNDEL